VLYLNAPSRRHKQVFAYVRRFGKTATAPDRPNFQLGCGAPAQTITPRREAGAAAGTAHVRHGPLLLSPDLHLRLLPTRLDCNACASRAAAAWLFSDVKY